MYYNQKSGVKAKLKEKDKQGNDTQKLIYSNLNFK